MIVYKVLRKDMKSAWATNKSMVTYKIDKWVFAPKWLAKMGYHLLAFRTLRDAKNFSALNGVIYRKRDPQRHLYENQCGEIYRAEAREATTILPTMVHNLCTDTKMRFMNYLNTHIGGSIYEFPKGTIMCKQIKLIKKVK